MKAGLVHHLGEKPIIMLLQREHILHAFFFGAEATDLDNEERSLFHCRFKPSTGTPLLYP